MKKICLFAFILCCIILIVGCTGQPDELTIVAEDVTNVPAGEYTLRYTITDYEKYHDSYQLKISVNVYDENNNSIPVTNNRTVTLEAEKTYTVVVRLTGKVKTKDISSSKQFTIETVRNDVSVTFYKKDGTVTQKHAEERLEYGGTILYSEVPTVPAFYAVQNDLQGHSRTIISKKWVVYDEDRSYHELSQDDLTEIKHDLAVYSFYEYSDVLITYTVSFDANGASTTPADQQGTINDILLPPEDRPEREGYVFLGWCTDEERKTYYNWKTKATYKSDMVLYAKWAKDNSDQASGDGYFTFTEGLDNYGNPYYTLEPTDVNRVPADLVLPSEYNGIPVRDLKRYAFRSSPITSVYIPETYTLNMDGAFFSCSNLQRVVFEQGNLRDVLQIYSFCDCTALESVVLPENIARISEGCFSGCLNLNDITLPDNLDLIGGSAFKNNKSLTSVTLPDSVTEIFEEAFSGCDSLTEVLIGKDSQLKQIASSAFNNTGLDELKLPSYLKDQAYLENSRIILTFYEVETE